VGECLDERRWSEFGLTLAAHIRLFVVAVDGTGATIVAMILCSVVLSFVWGCWMVD